MNPGMLNCSLCWIVARWAELTAVKEGKENMCQCMETNDLKERYPGNLGATPLNNLQGNPQLQ